LWKNDFSTFHFLGGDFSSLDRYGDSHETGNNSASLGALCVCGMFVALECFGHYDITAMCAFHADDMDESRTAFSPCIRWRKLGHGDAAPIG